MYCTSGDLALLVPSTVLAQLTDDTGGLTIGAAALTRSINAADAFIDSYMRGRHTVPFTTVPDEIRDCSASIALANLYERRPSMLETGIPTTIAEKKKEYIRWLEGVRDGKNIINVTLGTDIAQGFFKSSKTSDDLVFSSDTLDTY